MKADILRRAEELSDDEGDDEGFNKGKYIEVAFEDELEDGRLKVRDGEETNDDESDEREDDEVSVSFLEVNA